MRCISAAFAALLFSLAGSASAGTAETETVGQFLVSMPARSLDPVIDYCSESVPEIKDDLLKERAGLLDKLTEAGKPLMEKLKNDPEFNAPVRESMRQEIAKANSHALSIFKQQDPGFTCRTALANIQNATVGDLRKVVEALSKVSWCWAIQEVRVNEAAPNNSFEPNPGRLNSGVNTYSDLEITHARRHRHIACGLRFVFWLWPHSGIVF